MATAPPTLDRALQLAYRYVSARERTVEEMRAYLTGKLGESDVVGEAIDELVTQGLLDDERYARVYAEDKLLLESWGAERIRRGLIAKGIERGLADRAATVAGESEGGERERAGELLRRRFPEGPAEPRDRERAFGVLIRKGYDSELASEVVSRWARGVSDAC